MLPIKISALKSQCLSQDIALKEQNIPPNLVDRKGTELAQETSKSCHRWERGILGDINQEDSHKTLSKNTKHIYIFVSSATHL